MQSSKLILLKFLLPGAVALSGLAGSALLILLCLPAITTLLFKNTNTATTIKLSLRQT
ncbi:hypothetical protein [Flavitalea sp.]|nr:hypothetical protein [Flavitalea sp.]